MKVISGMMGHGSVAFTVDTYGHIIGGQQRAAMKKMDEVLSSGFTSDGKDGGDAYSWGRQCQGGRNPIGDRSEDEVMLGQALRPSR